MSATARKPRRKEKPGSRRKKGSGSLTQLSKVPNVDGLTRWLFRSPVDDKTHVVWAQHKQHAGELAADWEGERPKLIVEPGTVAEVVADWLAWKRTIAARDGSARPHTLEHYRIVLEKHVVRTIGTKQVAKLEPKDVDALLASTGLGATATNSLLTLLGMVFTWAMGRKRMLENPIIKDHRANRKAVRRSRRVALRAIVPTPAQREALHQAALAYDSPTAAGLAIAFGFETGLRRDELQHLRWEDVNLEGDVQDARVATDFRCTCKDCEPKGGVHWTKNGYDRYVPLSQRAAAILEESKRRAKADGTVSPWAFCVLRHAPYMKYGTGDILTRNHLGDAIEAITRAAGIELPAGLAVHYARHVAISWWEARGLTEDQRNLMTGHEADGVQAAYSHGDRVEMYRQLRAKVG
jgi:integrase